MPAFLHRFTIVVIALVGSLLVLNVLRTMSSPSGCYHQVRLASPVPDTCRLPGLRGPGRQQPILTMMVAPVYPANTTSLRRLAFVMTAWAELDHVNVIVLSRDCRLIELARDHGLLTLYAEDESDLDLLTYRFLLKSLLNLGTVQTEILAVANSDIVFDESLLQTMKAIMMHSEERRPISKNWNYWFAIGRRTNVDVDDDFISGRYSSVSALRFGARSSSLFDRTAQDYFVFTRGLPIDWNQIPPFFIGGVAFDNWFTSYVYNYWDVQMIDMTETVRALHINHGSNRIQSHNSLASQMNRLIAGNHHMLHGDSDQMPVFTTFNETNQIVIRYRNVNRWQ